MRYFPKKIEQKWQKRWLKERIYEPDLKKAKRPFYNLMMFPYPSAEGLHIGAVRTFSGVDIYGRFKRMQGHDVFEPIGLDGFGIHSENYALKVGKHPIQHAKDSEKNFYRQLENIGNGFAWDEKLETYDPDYYKWTQWIFVQMFKHGLAYRKKASVNWCPSCKTVLADEQVLQGECERCQAKVVKKELEQWFFKITDYAERLLKNLEKIDWPEPIKIAQRNWIGKSEGAVIKFPISNFQFPIEVFTTRPDTLFGATYIVLGPEHALIQSLKPEVKNWDKVEEYIKKAKAKTEEERIVEGQPASAKATAGKGKTGVELKGIKAINPATKEEIPIWVADYVLGHVGTGAIMAVPAHDERDFEFAKKFELPIRHVAAPYFEDSSDALRDGYPTVQRRTAYIVLRDPKTDKYACLDWKKFGWHTLLIGGIEDGESIERAALREINEETGYTNVHFVRRMGPLWGGYFAAHKKENRIAEADGIFCELVDATKREISDEEKKKHDVVWLSREEVFKFLTPSSQKYVWKLYLEKPSAYVNEGRLVNSGEFSGMDSEKARWDITEFVGGERKVQYRLRDWLISRQRYWGSPIPMIFCEKCNWQLVPEKDLPVKLPYIKEFRPTGTDKSPLATVEKFYKVRCPKCKLWARRETDVSDTFFDSAWYYIGYLMASENWKLKIGNSAFSRQARKWLPVDMYIGGSEHAVLHLLYVRFLAMALHDFGFIHFEEPFKKFRTHGLITKDGFKMSKSRGNVVSPDEYIHAYGIDAIRMYLAFLAPFGHGGDFRDTGIRGLTRFLERVWKLGQQKAKGKKQKSKLQRVVRQTIKKVTEDIESLQYNTAISALMVLLNEFEVNESGVSENDWKIFLKLLAPFAPFTTEELWQAEVKSKKFYSIHLEQWPEYDPKLVQEDTFELVIQVNGKVRGRITLPIGASEDEARTAALKQETVKQHVAGEPRKVIFIPNKLINFVV